jgi:nitroreductase
VSILDFFEVIRNRRSIRKYQDKNVEKEKLQRILEAARLAPSAMNRQPYQFFVVINKEILSKINSACNQVWKAPMMIAMVSNPKEAWARDDGEEYWKADAAIAMHQVSLAAYAEGLGTCWIAAFKEKEVKEILGVDFDSRVAFLSPLGYPAENKGPIRDRKTLESLLRNI